MSKNLKDMNQEDLIAWVRSLSLKFKNEIIKGIESFAKDNGIQYDGSMLISAKLQDIQDVTGLSQPLSLVFMKQIAAKKNTDYDANAPTDEPEDTVQEIITFTLKIEAKITHNIKNVNKNWTIRQCKYRFLRSLGQDGKAALYEEHANEKWVKPHSKDGIEFKQLGKNLGDEVTLGSIGILSGTAMPLVTTFRVNGGSTELKENEQDEYDKIRPRDLNQEKVKEAGLTLSNKPCCIMGYSDMDGVLRASMPCGCSFAADTMFRYMTSLFDKDLKSVRPICPVSKDECKGNDKQRVWSWGSVFVVADLSEREITRFTKAIENRLGSTKNCPNKNCGAVTEKNDDVRISRVNCSACNGSDWCWNCGKPWNHSGLGPICGNKGCMADRLNELLKSKNCGTMATPSGSYWNTTNPGEDIVKTRACPKCLCLLEFVAECKHMKCIACPHQFCHNCLGDWKTGECSHSIKCSYKGPQRFK